MFPVTRMLQRKCRGFNQASPAKSIQSTVKPLPMFIRFILVTLSGLIVCLVPNFSTLMNIIGAVFGTLLAFIMPGLCHYAIFRNNINRADVLMDYALIIIGCLGCILGVMEALYGEAPDVMVQVSSDNNHVRTVVQNALENVGVNGSKSDIPSSSIPSIGDHNVIKHDSIVAETLASSISNATAAISDKISSTINEINSTSAHETIGDAVS